ncbi:hypothetical protein C9439_05780 [archaeon SCG-AAA382B04]|nr:hypothetical protein C9439_05780 [archaeon SCG-AAA382B04]
MEIRNLIGGFVKKTKKAVFLGKWNHYKSLFLVLVFGILYGASVYNYLLFHSLVELFSIIIGSLIFVITWNSRDQLENNYLIFLGGAYFFIAGLDLFHTLAYKGMGVFPAFGSNLPTQLWISARYVEAATLLIAPILLGLKRKIKILYPFLIYLVIFIALLVSIFGGFFPTCYIEEEGLTAFKIVSEYLISIVLGLALYLLYKKKASFEKRIFNLLAVAIVLTIFSEIAFTFYISVYGFSNFVGHFFKLISFFLVYQALIVTGFREPFSLLFREKKEAVDREKFLHSLLRHDVKNKIQVIRGYLDLAKEHDIPEEAEKHIAKAIDGANNSMDIIKKVKTLVSLPKESQYKVELQLLIEGVSDEYKSLFDGDIKLECEKGIEVLGGSF